MVNCIPKQFHWFSIGLITPTSSDDLQNKIWAQLFSSAFLSESYKWLNKLESSRCDSEEYSSFSGRVCVRALRPEGDSHVTPPTFIERLLLTHQKFATKRSCFCSGKTAISIHLFSSLFHSFFFFHSFFSNTLWLEFSIPHSHPLPSVL